MVGVGLAPCPWDPQPPRPTLGRGALQDPFQSPNARLGPRGARNVRRGLGRAFASCNARRQQLAPSTCGNETLGACWMTAAARSVRARSGQRNTSNRMTLDTSSRMNR